jgi:hypothetical protein
MRSRLSRALFCAGLGAALFLGVGAALPVWSIPPSLHVIYGSPFPESDTDSAEDLRVLQDKKGSLGEAVAAKVEEWRYWDEIGVSVPLLRWDDGFVQGPLLLLALGALTGAGCYWAWSALKKRFWSRGGTS